MNTARALTHGLRAAVLISASLLAGCASDRPSGSGVEPLAAAPSGRVTGAPLGGPGNPRSGQSTPPPVPMAGRWVLASTAGGSCSMNFAGAPGIGEGTIAPEGGCPGNFFTSRRWIFDQGALVIRDHTGQPLAQLALAGGRFEGRATDGQTVTLGR
jgi:hypothetical protein